jgi:hypothetical protein
MIFLQEALLKSLINLQLKGKLPELNVGELAEQWLSAGRSPGEWRLGTF